LKPPDSHALAQTRLQPCGVRQFNLSKDPKFFDKLRDLVGLYVDPPAHAIVSSVDEKMKRAGFKLSVALHLGFPLSRFGDRTLIHD
jgi:hypothetical protein